jgi:citrate synthase
MIQAFWRKLPLNDDETILLRKLLISHHEATFRGNASSEVIKAAYAMNGGDFFKALAAGLCTLGGVHAPIEQTYDVLNSNLVSNSMTLGIYPDVKIPGWGNSFVKGKPDPIVENVMLYVDVGWPELGKRIELITAALHERGKKVFPNMSCATAATGIILGLPKELTPVLLLHGRALAWAEILYDAKA